MLFKGLFDCRLMGLNISGFFRIIDADNAAALILDCLQQLRTYLRFQMIYAAEIHAPGDKIPLCQLPVFKEPLIDIIFRPESVQTGVMQYLRLFPPKFLLGGF